jgi:hypothetical protein
VDTLASQETDMSKHLCQRCRDRKGRFRCRGIVRADRDHTLCFQCYRRERDRARAQRLVESGAGQRIVSPFASNRVLDEREIAHRQRMLEHLREFSAAARS